MTPDERARLLEENKRLREALKVCREACRANLVFASRKDEPQLLEAFNVASAALSRSGP